MKFTTILKGFLGLALIYLVCVPIVSLGQVIEANKNNSELKKVEFNPVVRGRVTSWENEKFIDGYYSLESKKCLAIKRS
jgi:hypothetical protein